MSIKVYHDTFEIPKGDNMLYIVYKYCPNWDNIPEGVNVMHIDYGMECIEKVAEIAKKGEAFTIYTNRETSDYEAPCGCTGYDEPCDWHRGYNRSDFASCLCSHTYNITCNYHDF
jgi:hypothetical protein